MNVNEFLMVLIFAIVAIGGVVLFYRYFGNKKR